VRNALIVLVVVALVLVALGAVNHGLLFDIDFVVGTWTAVSLFWVAVVTAGLVFVTGLVAAWLARAGAVTAQRKLEKELQGTYERLRAAEAKLPRPEPVKAAVVDVAPAAQTAVTSVVPAPGAVDAGAVEAATVGAGSAGIDATPEAQTTADAAPEAQTAGIDAAPEAQTSADAAPEAQTSADATPEAQTAVIDAVQEAETAVSDAVPEAPAADATDDPPPSI
jgi:hypothetical protein